VTSLSYDRGLKARLYARRRFHELWVVDGARRATFVHREAEGEGWRSIVERGPDEALTLAALPDFSMRLGAV
jgi:Uma2 family endonuclease